MKVAVVGAGKMGRALVQGLMAGGLAQAGDITGVARSEESRRKFLELHGDLKWSGEAGPAAAAADVVLLGVKPGQILEVAAQLKQLQAGVLIVSVAAGVTLAAMQGVLGRGVKLVRAMPNTPVVVGEGVTAFAAASTVGEADKAWVRSMFGSLGKVYEVAEEQIDAVTALSGSGPAYFYLFAGCLEKAAMAEGLPGELARAMAAQTALGAAKMLLSGQGDPEALIAQVKSKGGTTEAALEIFQERDLAGMVKEAVAAAARRSRELSGSKQEKNS